MRLPSVHGAMWLVEGGGRYLIPETSLVEASSSHSQRRRSPSCPSTGAQ